MSVPPRSPETAGTSAVPFERVAETFRDRLVEFHAHRGLDLSAPTGRRTLLTNSFGAAERGASLEAMLGAAGLDSVAGLDVLDVGCGFGALSAYLASRGGRVAGVDPNAAVLRVGRAVARAHGLEVTFEAGTMERLRFPTGSFDLVVMNNTLCYVTDLRARVRSPREVHRVLNPGGWIITRNPNGWFPRDQFTGIPLVGLLPPDSARRLVRRLGRPRPHVRLSSPALARRELAAAGFERIEQHAMPHRPTPSVLMPLVRYHHFSARSRSPADRP